ncbi:E3 ubiquitin-protein ligase-like protein bre1 [Westerdykella ornata]|uniref:E3 ubiquitin protein ligase n=1 Tax=Westerdykella ornata TaxID=318751 RepID=A0A6A6JCB9_WESOR|nr:E3 ubiquitin-protein ligase-like protein bre1 [Westerdykella ornata]KAF2273864.1 E3 ubiquitin-protein ligase-like protein bre1 [Westerdykella ornata]
MRLAARTVLTPSLDAVKMDDRKRPAGQDDTAPPPKRQALSVNGAKSHQDDVPWKDDIEAYQKDAILRQMREYKREKNTIEAELRKMEERAKDHDDHLRVIDTWFEQLLDEIRVLVGEKLPDSDSSKQRLQPPVTVSATSNDINIGSSSIPTTLFFEDSEAFSKHLASRREKILAALSDLFGKFPPSTPEVSDLNQRLGKVLAREKQLIADLQKVNSEKEHTSDRLDTATLRYMLAEKKLDRLKSIQVQKLERQAQGGNVAVKEESSSVSNGAEAVGSANGVINEELETARDAAMAEAAKRKEQLEQLEQENKKLTAELSSLNVKLAGLSDDDYAKTELFKVLKSQHEDVIKRINHLEATNIQLREEAKKLQAERTEYRIKVDDEARATISESEGNVARAEADLARIRSHRDELLTEVSTLKAILQDNTVSRTETKELVSACESRISALESECERLRLQLAENAPGAGDQAADLENMTPDQLKNRIATLENQHRLLNNELPAMEAAWKKAQAVAGRKIAEISTWEENVGRANADKAKADQKYFAAMKAKETLAEQNRVLRVQANKSTEIVTQLKEAEAHSRSLVDKLEKQCAEMRAQMEELSIQHRTLQQKLKEMEIASEGHANQVSELKKVVEAKDAAYLASKHSQRESETERDKLAAQVHGLEKQCQHWKKKSAGNQSEDAAMMQSMLQCQVCKTNFKDTVIKTCGHVFCDKCVQDRLINRARKCPHCGKAFGNNDTMRIHL